MDSVFSLNDNRQLYEVLGVASTASVDEIRRAFKKLAVLYHPDKNPAGGDKFKEISFAYNILTDDEQRELYDQQTLRSFLNKEARQKDPMMDPDVELSPEDLQKFVERLKHSQKDDEKRRKDFEEKKRAELQRRAEFDRQNPGFRMPDLPSVSQLEEMKHKHNAFASFKTTADMKEALDRKLGSENVPPQDDVRQSMGSAGSSQRQRMMSEFREARKAKGVDTFKATTVPDYTSTRGTSFSQPITYDTDPDHIRNAGKGFDFRTFVEEGFIDGGAVGKAILADALDDYQPKLDLD